jgi:hypothetical protein
MMMLLLLVVVMMMMVLIMMMIEGEHVALQSIHLPLYVNLEAVGNERYAP